MRFNFFRPRYRPPKWEELSNYYINEQGMLALGWGEGIEMIIDGCWQQNFNTISFLCKRSLIKK